MDRVERLRLAPHPEGGFYRQVFKSSREVRPGRAALTAIYFLLPSGDRSRWHRVMSDEIWTHLEGGGVRLYLFDGERVTQHIIGPLSESAEPICAVPAGVWQAAEPVGDDALVACFVAPGFEFEDFTLMADDRDASARLSEVDAALMRLV